MKNLIIIILLSAILSITITGQTRPYQLINETFAVGAGHAKSWNFRSPNCISVTGVFRAQGGNKNDIKVLIMEAIAFENWKNGHTVETLYNSGQITTAKFTVNLNKTDDFVIVFSNNAGLVQRSVTASVGLYPCRR